jgi:hypothetical protein
MQQTTAIIPQIVIRFILFLPPFFEAIPNFPPGKTASGTTLSMLVIPTYELRLKCNSNYTNEIGFVFEADIYVTNSVPKTGSFSQHSLCSKFQTVKNHCTERSKFGSKDIAVFCQLFLLFLVSHRNLNIQMAIAVNVLPLGI